MARRCCGGEVIGDQNLLVDTVKEHSRRELFDGRAGRLIKANVRIDDGGRDDSVASAGVDLLAELVRPFEQSASITICVWLFLRGSLGDEAVEVLAGCEASSGVGELLREGRVGCVGLSESLSCCCWL